MLDNFKQLSHQFLTIKNSPYKRYLIRSTNFNATRLSLVVGQRGVGKTTTLVQSLLANVKGDLFSDKILYVQADHFQMGSNTLYEIAEEFLAYGGKWIAYDEIHKYPDWSKELKSIYDTFPKLQVLASGSSAMQINKSSHDLSRRAVRYNLRGLSFREYLEISYNMELKSYKLNEICENHARISAEIIDAVNNFDLKIIPLFQHYLKFGYYPYFNELQKNEDLYRITLEQNIHTIIESDLSAIFPSLTGNSIRKIKQLLIFIADSVPLTPNFKKISDVLEVGDDRTLKTYFKHLEDAGLIRSLFKATDKFNRFETPEKIYLDNPNQLFTISTLNDSEIGTVRETFFLSMLPNHRSVTFPQNGDFLVDKKYCFEIGGKNKGFEQLKAAQNSYVVSDNIEHGAGRRIPLWLFGFLY
ncbi:MAG: AAA family ATPase [Chlamydiae bacterium]|nr:AAA family ATPase [Chlamydiota bacterium]